MGSTYLDPYRRHLANCPHKSKGQNFSLCKCPIWAYGRINGVIYRRTLQTTDAGRAMAKIAFLVSNPTIAVDHSKTIGQGIASYLNECAKRNLRPSSIASYTRTLGQFSAFAGERPIAQLTTDLIANFRDSRKVAPRTRRKELEFIRALCTFCVDRQWLTRKPGQAH